MAEKWAFDLGVSVVARLDELRVGQLDFDMVASMVA